MQSTFSTVLFLFMMYIIMSIRCIVSLWLIAELVFTLDILANGFTLCFDPDNEQYRHFFNYFPSQADATLPDAERIFNIPAMMYTRKPIIAFMCDENKQLLKIPGPEIPANTMLELVVSSVDAENDAEDMYEGRLCHHVNPNPHVVQDPFRFDSAYQKFSCGSDSNRTILDPIKVANQPVVVAQNLLHTVATSFPRRYKLQLLLNGEAGPSIKTEAFSISEPVYRVRWDEPQNFKNIVANQPFSIALSIIYNNGTVVQSGLGSALYVQVCIGYKDKYFYHNGVKAGRLNFTKALLAGREVIVSKENRDMLLLKQAVKGHVRFEDVRILDTTENTMFNFQLNATLIVPNCSLPRYPFNFSDIVECRKLKKAEDHDYSKYDIVQYLYSYKKNCSEANKYSSLTETFPVYAQRAHSLKIRDLRLKGSRIVKMANEPLCLIEIEVLDEKGNRIFTGKDSSLELEVTTDPKNIKLSDDFNTTLERGSKKCMGSVIEISDRTQDMTLCFHAKSALKPDNALISACTKKRYNITNTFRIAIFGHLSTSGSESRLDPLIETFARFAAEDINDQVALEYGLHEIPVLPGRRFLIDGYDTKGTIQEATVQLHSLLQKIEYAASERANVIIGFYSDGILSKLNTLMRLNDLNGIALQELVSGDWEGWVLRFSWGLVKTCEAFSMFLEHRNWKNVIVISSENSGTTKEMNVQFDKRNISIQLHIQFTMLPDDPKEREKFVQTIIPAQLKKIIKLKFNIIINLATAPLQYYIFREAINLKLDCKNGYQWLSLELAGLDFPFSNNHIVCRQTPTCTDGMECMLIFLNSLWINNPSDLWVHAHFKFFEADRTLYRGMAKARDFHLVAQYAKAYDAVLLVAYAFKSIISKNKTMTAHILHEAMEQVSFTGLTGHVELEKESEEFNRKGDFVGVVVSVRNVPNGTFEDRHQVSRFLMVENDSLIEVVVQRRNEPLRELNIPVTNFKSKHKFKSYRGVMDARTQKMKPFPETYSNLFSVVSDISEEDEQASTEKPKNRTKRQTIGLDLTEIVEREEDTSQDYYCAKGCGGGIEDKYDAHKYKNGYCVSPNKCQCKTVKELAPTAPKEYWNNLAYMGDTCRELICHGCKNGVCIGPEICLCHKGYSGARCDEAFCSGGCGPGRCILPNQCSCPAGYGGHNCQYILTIAIMPFVVLSVLLILCCFKMCVHWNEKRKLLRLAESTNWLVKWIDVTPVEDTLESQNTQPVAPVGIPARYIHNIMMWNKQKVYVEKFVCESLDVASQELRSEIYSVIHLRHVNVIPFCGVCMDSPNVAILTEFFPKGSLQDVLCSRLLPLDWDLKFSMLKDIVKGMEYLHNNIGSHGQLTSRNCLMDNRWCIRIGGFGVPTIRCKPLQEIEEEDPAKMMWTAPELLRKYDRLHQVIPGTQHADVYSFAIIVSEICNEDAPYSVERQFLSTSELLLLVKSPSDPSNRGLKLTWENLTKKNDEFVRPSVAADSMPVAPEQNNELSKLISNCWKETPSERMPFHQIVIRLQVIQPMKGELVDLLIKRLEQYTVKLEDDFLEASKDLQNEKLKMEELLGRMLPKKIVEDMVHGKTIGAEEFECVSICFSDIADFLHISGYATPFKIIQLLNNLYTRFDSIIDNFDVYKVETVRDEYMVVSGLPTRNGYQHASEIATLALYLMSSITDFEIPFECPDKILMLRIGIHSGPCVAGIVGLHMPRYCLFGDTVNTASRMKTSSSALRIHMSDFTFSILKILGGFDVKYRGERDIKGKGKMVTHWLLGKTDFTGNLPDENDAVDAELQEFK